MARRKKRCSCGNLAVEMRRGELFCKPCRNRLDSAERMIKDSQKLKRPEWPDGPELIEESDVSNPNKPKKDGNWFTRLMEKIGRDWPTF